jgi:4-amino-4-deoxy-L-arabinose transferase-like glycosyltransferase
VLGAWLRTPLPILREQLKVLQFWSLEICLALALCLAAVMLREWRRTLHRHDVMRMAILAAVATALTVLVAPRTNRIYYDEQIYQGIGQNLSDLKLAQMCNDGTVEYGRLQCWSGEYNKQPYAYPHLLSVLYRAFGVSPAAAFVFNAAAMVLTVCGVYLLVLMLFRDRTAAFFAGLILSLIPQQILWSATAAVEPSASLACVAALLCAATFCETKSTAALTATGVVTAYAVQFRPESLLIVPVIGVVLWVGGSRGEFSRARPWAVALLSLALVAVHVGHMVAVRNEGWGATDARLSLGYVLPNLRVNGAFYLIDARFPVAFTLLAIVGLAGASFRVTRVCFAAYFLLFFGIYLLFHAGSYNYGADVRYSVMTYPPIAVLGGLGTSGVVAWLSQMRFDVRAISLVTTALVFQFLWYAPLVRATTEEAWAARADVRFAASLVPQLRGNAYVLTHNPGMFHVWGVNAGQISLTMTNKRQWDFLAARYGGGGVYLHWNFWCNVTDPVQAEFCQRALEGRPVTLMHEYRERDQRYALYRFMDQSADKMTTLKAR